MRNFPNLAKHAHEQNNISHAGYLMGFNKKKRKTNKRHKKAIKVKLKN